MPKLTVSDLKKIKEKHLAEANLRDGAHRAKIVMHMGTCGIAAGARDVMTELNKLMADNNVSDVMVSTSGCAGLCSKEPMATVELEGEAPVKYIFLDADKIKRIFEEHIQGGNVVEDYAFVAGHESSY
jgi:NADP-reducing hydrogenase subunit HndB